MNGFLKWWRTAGLNVLLVVSLLASAMPVSAQAMVPAIAPADVVTAPVPPELTEVPVDAVVAPMPTEYVETLPELVTVTPEPPEAIGTAQATTTPEPKVSATPTVTPTGRRRMSASTDAASFQGWKPSFNRPTVSLFRGAATYSTKIEVPAGRGGVQPDLTLNYNSSRVDGIFTWAESDWVGVGWAMGLPEVVRTGTYMDMNSDASSSWYVRGTQFTLLLNGTGYELKAGPGVTNENAGRYYAKDAPQIRIDLVNETAPHALGQTWYITMPNGISYRLGYNQDSEQVVGDQGDGSDFVYRWRMDQMRDRSGNLMEASYRESQDYGFPLHNRASALEEIRYNNYISNGTTYWMTKVKFNLVTDSFDHHSNVPGVSERQALHSNGRIDSIEIQQMNTVMRRYQFTYAAGNVAGGSGSMGPMFRLTEIQQRNGDNSAGLPSTKFTYTDKENRYFDSTCTVNCEYRWATFAYPRLTRIENGYGGKMEFDYLQDDTTTPNSYSTGYAYRVSQMRVYDGIHTAPVTSTYTYAVPSYDPGLLGCPVVTETITDRDGSFLARSEHYFHIDGKDSWRLGREYRAQHYDSSGRLLSKNETTWDVIPVPLSDLKTTLGVREEVVSTDYTVVPTQTRRTAYRYDTYGNAVQTLDYGNTMPVVNGGFEAGLSNWTVYGATPSVITSTDTGIAFAGNAILQMTGQGFIYQDLPGLIPGEFYVARALVRKSGTTNSQFVLAMHSSDTTNPLGTTVTPGTTWTSVTLTFQAMQNGFGRLYLRYYSGSDTIYVDEVSVARQADTLDDRLTYRGYSYIDTAGKWFILPWYENIHGEMGPNVEATLKTQTITYYDDTDGVASHMGQTSQITRGLATMQLTGIYNTIAPLKYITTGVQYDGYGNAVLSIDANKKSTTTEYDSLYHIYPLRITNALGQFTALDYYGVGSVGLNGQLPGLLRRIWDTNHGVDGDGISTLGAMTGIYDTFGRLIKLIKPGDSEALPTESWGYYDNNVNYSTNPPTPLLVTHFVRQESGVAWGVAGFGTEEATYYDGLGQVIQTQSPGSGWNVNTYLGQQVVQSTQYDGAGRVVAQSLPYTKAQWSASPYYQYQDPASNAAILWSTTKYNVLGQAVQVVRPDQSKTTALGLGGFARVESSSGQVKVSMQDGRGQTVREDELLPIFDEKFINSAFAGTGYWGVYQPTGSGAAFENEVYHIWNSSASQWFSLERLTNKVMGQGNTSTGTYGHEVQVDFMANATTANPHLVLDTNSAPTHRCGIGVENGKISMEVITNTASAYFTLFSAIKANTWYRGVIRLEAQGQCRVEVWERDNPAEHRAAEYEIDPADIARSLHFHAYLLNGNIWIDNYRESAIQKTLYNYDVIGNLTSVVDTLYNTTVMTYNTLGQKIAMKDPDMGVWYYTYDPAGNLLTQVDARRRAMAFWYDDLNRLIVKADGGANRDSSYTRPADWNGLSVLARYYYDEVTGVYGNGQRTRMTDSSGTTSWQYDKWGRMEKEIKTITGAPSTFETQLAYNARNDVTLITYPGYGGMVETNFNERGLPSSLSYFCTGCSGSFVTGASYDYMNRLTGLTYGNGVADAYQYDALDGRVRQMTTTLNSSVMMNLWYGYDPAGNVRTIQDRTRDEISWYRYDSLDRLISFQPLSQSNVEIGIYARGTMQDNVWPTMQLWVDRVLVKEWVVNSATDQTYTANAPISSGSEVAVVFANAKGSRSLTVSGGYIVAGILVSLSPGSFRYDRGSGAAGFDDQNVTLYTGSSGWYMAENGALRMTVGTSPAISGDGESYTYNATGNMTSKAGVTYSYGNAAHIHGVSARSNGDSFTYDENGNMLSRTINGQTYVQTFDLENRLASVTVGGQVTTFTYDGDGKLAKKVVSGGATTYYVNGIYELKGTEAKSYYSFGGKQVAMMTVNNGYYPGRQITYLHGDHLGSGSYSTNNSGLMVGVMRYKPFGAARSGFNPGNFGTDRLFTGQRQEATLGLYDYNARYYDPELGRFISADSIVPGVSANAVGYFAGARLTPLTVNLGEFPAQVHAENAEITVYGPFYAWSGKIRQQHVVPSGPANPQTLNRYSYVLNNPLQYVDPTGHEHLPGYDIIRLTEYEGRRLLRFLNAVIDFDARYGGVVGYVASFLSTAGGALAATGGALATAIGPQLVPLVVLIAALGISYGVTIAEIKLLRDALQVALSSETPGITLTLWHDFLCTGVGINGNDAYYTPIGIEDFSFTHLILKLWWGVDQFNHPDTSYHPHEVEPVYSNLEVMDEYRSYLEQKADY